ncbi:hypothetical protein KIW84_043347 [Lathyrus oleraceus]|uniref:Uncharacterized protein n=1 Tax=Pisum sativum TaxID=3888 RepID=A0A9D4XF31_PEA|nr:hypothetical protein KIW84_043347 [Pisum sativum]
MLHLLGMVIAIARLILACLARGDKRTEQRHFGEVESKAPTLLQHAGETFALTLREASKHGLRLAAAEPIGVFPHSPALSVSMINKLEANRNITTVARKVLTLKSIL